MEQISVRKDNVILSEPIILELENQSTEFAIGLKMLSEVMIKNKTHPLFAAFLPAFVDFMKKLKS